MFKGLQKPENGPMGKELDGQMKTNNNNNNNNKHNDFFSLYFFTFSLLFLISLY